MMIIRINYKIYFIHEIKKVKTPFKIVLKSLQYQKKL